MSTRPFPCLPCGGPPCFLPPGRLRPLRARPIAHIALLDLGDVRNLAEVFVNGKPAGIAWKVPYRLNVTGLLKPGENELRIGVVNAWGQSHDRGSSTKRGHEVHLHQPGLLQS
jgi:hypothetical protein